MDEQVVANRYVLERELGRGGMAIVYRARDTRLNRPVALKLLHPYLASQTESANRFERESEAIAKLHHTNIVEIFDAGVDEQSGSHFIVMELIDGCTLNRFIADHPTVIPEIGLAIGCCLCDAIAHAHQAKILHRDIKPENIMISSDGVIKLMDFGIARMMDEERMTASGSIVGSPAHMPPELIEGQKSTFVCDIFSLGTVIYYTVTNQLPFAGNTPMSVFKSILDGSYIKPSRVNERIPQSFDTVIAKCLETDPAARYQSAPELKKDLLALLEASQMPQYNDVLARYFGNPEDFNSQKQTELVGILQTQAKSDIDAHRIPSAVNHINRILAYDQKNEVALELMDLVRHGDVVKRWTRISIVISLVIVIGFILANVLSSKQDDGWEEITPRPGRSVQPVATAEIAQQTGTAPAAVNTPQNDMAQENPAASKPDTTTQTPASSPSIPPDTNHPANAQKIENPPSIQNSESPKIEKKAQDSNTTPSTELPDTQKDAQTDDTRADSGKPRTRTPKKVRETENENKSDNQTDPEPASPEPDSEVPDATNPEPAVRITHVTQPVYPPDGFAVINGKRYESNSSGDIAIDLPPGKYAMTLSCPKRCVAAKSTLVVPESDKPVQQEIVSLDWADASLTLYGPEGMDLYYVARRLDDHNNRVFHLVARAPNAVTDFNAFGKPIQLEVYAIPTSHTLKSYDVNALERAKYASTRISMSPGESRTVRF